MTKYLLAATLLTATLLPAQEGPTRTQALIALDSKSPQTPTSQNIIIKVNDRATPLTSLAPIPPTGAQVALLIDDGLRTSVGRQLDDIRNFITTLPQGTEIFIGYMENGRVVPAQEFTTDYASAAKNLRIPMGTAGASASPYFCLSDFTKHWPGAPEREDSIQTPKARFVMMLTNGVDPYNGSVSPLNQNSTYVDAAVADAQRAGIAVYSIYYGDSGIRGEAASFSGQSYLSEVAEGTGGRTYYQGTGNPVSIGPFLKQFRGAIAETYVATFEAPGNKNMVRIKLSTNLPGTKVRAAQEIRPGTAITP
ncbi:hypothetical protein EDE15_5094 [Edaphobacter aggregans]|uniref:VWFA-related protein n=1 Tax=Edaphobacter aggregans TaxID=570835 RepID=A0A428MR86_9BACT|nr:hypothetical protein [Edaphobacter aggregans]RSL19427.1 hypothetical protein EDE15_5094 [Edaphobacter aggregans]